MNDGSILVGDGYCNSRVMRYNPDGSFHSEYSINPTGHPGHSGRKLSAAKDMAVVHSLVVDECSDDLVVADRENRAVHTFDLHTGQLKGVFVYVLMCVGRVLVQAGPLILRCSAELQQTSVVGVVHGCNQLLQLTAVHNALTTHHRHWPACA